ncbi:plastid ribosomal protein of the 30S subunit 10 [Hibiscus trionum]|uniref:Small ribosomal subunit protein uS10c n=2 Tax=Hibiscus trionum TaxID=183268 RepID=A0A9W7J189_HIBTR|nr:plastid ribosomal protein of the 30S subunit 10 [Hibiscus trionum]
MAHSVLDNTGNSAMAMSSISSTLIPSLPIQNAASPKPNLTFFNHLKLRNNTLQLSQSPTKLFAAPESLEEIPEVGSSEIPSSSFVAEADKAAPKQKIRIKLRSYWVPLIEDSCKQIIDAARTTNAKTMGPVPLPTKKRIYCVLKSPHVHKDARFHFETRTHQRLIDILYPTAQTIDSLMQLDLPAGVDVEVKL